MNDMIATTCGFGLIGIATLMCVWLVFGPVEDQAPVDEPEREPDVPPPCWCRAFGQETSTCYCVGFDADPKGTERP
ncbi:hypothetical protein ALI144C_44990 [Actinosynnema sp. ALI-1.44]|uniref:hypothetical protein n=1 Tax=Actinosynnema sp. ALI-1.44 TaxID=1933779 RepID=UPI00097C9C06|nr:hypothetical protein [Actinosynnema sp. ALI-1.44]ONI73109.1 hypothetical protein ALI144C_44990 [Actinosynnema sp. ALI-1.44]